MAVLAQYGRSAFQSSEARRGQCIGYSIYAACDAAEVIDAACEMLEEWNCHLSVAAVRAIERGDGKVVRKGRKLTILLPKHWE
jgi:hypothetical protein